MWFSTSSGSIELRILTRDAIACSHPGPCDSDVATLVRKPYIKRQLAAIAPDILRDELREYGAWDDDELADTVQNRARIVWIAACDIAEGVN